MRNGSRRTCILTCRYSIEYMTGRNAAIPIVSVRDNPDASTDG